MQELYNKLRPLLSNPKTKLGDLMSVRYELAEARAKVLLELLELRPKRLRPKDKEWTDLDRKTEMQGFTAQLEHDKQFLDDLWVIIDDMVKAKMMDTDGREPSHPEMD